MAPSLPRGYLRGMLTPHPNIKRHWFETDVENGFLKTVLVVETDLVLSNLAEGYDQDRVSEVVAIVQGQLNNPTVDRARLIPIGTRNA